MEEKKAGHLSKAQEMEWQLEHRLLETLELATKYIVGAVSRCSRDLRYIWVNQEHASWLQRPLDEIVGRPILDVLGAEAFETLRPYFEQVLTGERVIYEKEVNYQGFGRRWISAVYTPTLDTEGIVNGWVAVVANITERKRVEEVLRRSEADLAESQRLASLGSWRWDPETDTVTWSEELYRMAGLDPNRPAVSYTEHSKLYTAESWERLRAAVEKTLLTGTPYELDLEMVRSDDTRIWLFARGEAQRDTTGRIVQLRGTVQDITERKQAEEALATMSRKLIEAQEEERRRIARELHDEFSQRVALLAVRLDGLNQALPTKAAEIRRALGEVKREVVDLGSDIHALSHRLHSSKLEQLGLAAAAAGFCRELSDQQNVEVDFHSEGVPRDLPQEVALCLFRVLQEALQNATKHSGSRRFQASLNGELDEIQLTVSDQGIGFERMVATRGRGIGLMSMKERLKLVNGDLSIDSQRQHGTVIHARVPLIRGSKYARAAG